jgi:hypothetical protein
MVSSEGWTKGSVTGPVPTDVVSPHCNNNNDNKRKKRSGITLPKIIIHRNSVYYASDEHTLHAKVAILNDSHIYKVEEILGPPHNSFVKFGFSFSSLKGKFVKSCMKGFTESESSSQFLS